MAEKRKSTYGLDAFKAAARQMRVTVVATRTAAALGFGRAEDRGDDPDHAAGAVLQIDDPVPRPPNLAGRVLRALTDRALVLLDNDPKALRVLAAREAKVPARSHADATHS